MGQLLSQNQPGVIPQGINFNQNAQAPMVSSNNISSNSQVRNNPNIQMEPSNLMHANPPNNQPISRYITVPPNINNGTSINQIAPNLQTYHNSSPNLINDKPLYQASEQNKPLQVLQPKTTQISNPKQKFNPF
jgi:hypothetical protein